MPAAAKLADWAICDALPQWAAEMVMYRRPHPTRRVARRAVQWTVINASQAVMGPLREFREATARVASGVAGGPGAHTEPHYIPGTDPIRPRELVEQGCDTWRSDVVVGGVSGNRGYPCPMIE